MSFSEIVQQLGNDPVTRFAAPLFLIAILVEAWVGRARSLYLGRDTMTSLVMLVFSSIVDFLPKVAAFAGFYFLHEWSPMRDVVGRQWWAWVLLFFLDDFVYYWFHRANHEVRLFWAGHVPHHSSVYLNFGTALRQGVGERIHKYLFWIPLPLLGFDALMIFTMIAANLVYQFWVHTQLVGKLHPLIEFIFNTPSHHRVHHASNIRYLDCNHGGVLIIWDRLFGTFSEETSAEPPVYGLTKNIHTYNPVRVVAGEYANLLGDVFRAPGWLSKLRYLFLAPGWHHDGPDKRARVLRAKVLPAKVPGVGMPDA